MKAFIEGYVFNEAVMACEQTTELDAIQMETGGQSTSVIGLNSVRLDKYNIAPVTRWWRTAFIVITIRSKERPRVGSSFLERE